ncbi:hypothetical protein [Dyadobacter sandarakinus]|nr:hypothetical protein [Dyadobacter sandarakinus]
MQLLALPLTAAKHGATCNLEIGTSGFSPFSVRAADKIHSPIIVDDSICTEETIVRADESEWKDNLSELLGYRHSTYRFLSLIVHAAPSFYLSGVTKAIRESLILSPAGKGLVPLPDYYSFLHRLCPF